MDYIFFLEVSAIFILPVSAFLEVSFAAFAIESFINESLANESAEAVDFLPEQAANDTATASAKAPNLIEFFIVSFLNVIK